MDLFASLFFRAGLNRSFFLPVIQEKLIRQSAEGKADSVKKIWLSQGKIGYKYCNFNTRTERMKIESSQLDKVFHDFLTLKKLRRTGWQLRGIRNGESIADHCFGVVLLTYMLAGIVTSVKINREHAVSIAIIHELGESRVGDIPYTALKYFPDKSSIEQQAVEDVLSPLGSAVTEESLSLFKEFEEGSSVEARFVRAIDKVDMLITAAEYEKTGFAGLSDFWHNNATFKPLEEFPELAKYAENLRLTRERRVSGHHDQH
jgi:putative hydrolase of HD superfamily